VKDASTDPETIRGWWDQWPNANVGIATGECSGMDALDVDGDIGAATVARLCGEHGELPAGPKARTGSGGAHYLFKHATGLSVGRDVLGKVSRVDLRGDGGYIVAAPSLHASGGIYLWETDPGSCAIPEWPEWLLEIVRRKGNETIPATPEIATETTDSTSSPPIPPAVMAEETLPNQEALVELAEALKRLPSVTEAWTWLGAVAASQNRLRTVRELVTEEGRLDFDTGAAGSRKHRRPKSVDGAVAQEIQSAVRRLNRPDDGFGDDPRPRIEIGSEITEMADGLREALTNDPNVRVFRRAGALVEVADGDTGLEIVPASPARLDEIAATVASWWKSDSYGQLSPSLPSRRVVQAVFAHPTKRIPLLKAISYTPTLRLDGSILDTPGFDAASGIYYCPNAVFPAIPLNPTREEACAAREIIFDPVQDYPFVEGCDRSALFALIFTCLARHALVRCSWSDPPSLAPGRPSSWTMRPSLLRVARQRAFPRQRVRAKIGSVSSLSHSKGLPWLCSTTCSARSDRRLSQRSSRAQSSRIAYSGIAERRRHRPPRSSPQRETTSPSATIFTVA